MTAQLSAKEIASQIKALQAQQKKLSSQEKLIHKYSKFRESNKVFIHLTRLEALIGADVGSVTMPDSWGGESTFEKYMDEWWCGNLDCFNESEWLELFTIMGWDFCEYRRYEKFYTYRIRWEKELREARNQSGRILADGSADPIVESICKCPVCLDELPQPDEFDFEDPIPDFEERVAKWGRCTHYTCKPCYDKMLAVPINKCPICRA